MCLKLNFFCFVFFFFFLAISKCVAAPFTLLPSPVPKALFEKVYKLAPAFQKLKHDVVNDVDFLKSTLKTFVAFFFIFRFFFKIMIDININKNNMYFIFLELLNKMNSLLVSSNF